MPSNMVFDQRPWLIYWEITRACALACQHCRAEAIAARDPRELTFAEGKQFLRSLLLFGSPYPHLVITGGDPLWRPDLFDLIAYGRELGLGISLAPSVTERLEPSVFTRCKELGVSAISLSLDGSDAQRHDRVRGIEGCFERTVRLARAVRETGVDLQVNTLVTGDTLDDLDHLYELVGRLGAMRWSLFFLIAVGRGTALRELSPQQAEDVCHWLADLLDEAPFQIKTTEAPHFRRVVIQKRLAQGWSMRDIRRLPLARGFGVRDGNGIVFVSHTGEVHLSGFLPLAAGNVRDEDVVTLYREAELFQQVRDPDRYSGKCGRCEFRRICGGSRARAFAATGNPLGSDPLCPYQPQRSAAAG